MWLFSFLLFDFTPFIHRVFLLISLSVCVLLRSALWCVLAIGLDLDIGFEKKKRQKRTRNTDTARDKYTDKLFMLREIE